MGMGMGMGMGICVAWHVHACSMAIRQSATTCSLVTRAPASAVPVSSCAAVSEHQSAAATRRSHASAKLSHCWKACAARSAAQWRR